MLELFLAALWIALALVGLGSVYLFLRSAGPNSLAVDTRYTLRRQITDLVLFTAAIGPATLIAAMAGLWDELRAAFSSLLTLLIIIGPPIWAVALVARASTLRGAPIPPHASFHGGSPHDRGVAVGYVDGGHVAYADGGQGFSGDGGAGDGGGGGGGGGGE